MRSVRRLLVVGATIVALAAIVPSASAASPKAFHLEKTCGDYFLCTVQWSNFDAIPKDTDVTYTYDSTFYTGGDGVNPAAGWDGLAWPSLEVRNGSTTGVCDWTHPSGDVLAVCTFGTGTGRLTQFHLSVDVSFDGTTWFWDGTYWFGGGH
jgi:hypothetical protein